MTFHCHTVLTLSPFLSLSLQFFYNSRWIDSQMQTMAWKQPDDSETAHSINWTDFQLNGESISNTLILWRKLLKYLSSIIIELVRYVYHIIVLGIFGQSPRLYTLWRLQFSECKPSKYGLIQAQRSSSAYRSKYRLSEAQTTHVTSLFNAHIRCMHVYAFCLATVLCAVAIVLKRATSAHGIMYRAQFSAYNQKSHTLSLSESIFPNACVPHSPL